MSDISVNRFMAIPAEVPLPLSAGDPKSERSAQAQNGAALRDPQRPTLPTEPALVASARTADTPNLTRNRSMPDSVSVSSKVPDAKTAGKLASVTIDGTVQIGVDVIRGIGPGEFGYLAFDPIAAGAAGIKFAQNKQLTPNDAVPIRLHIEAGLKGIANIPGVGPELARLLAEKYPKLAQGQIGAAADIVVSGRRDGKPGLEIKQFDMVGYVNIPPPPGEISVRNGKVSPGGLDKNLANVSFGVTFSAEKGWGWIEPSVLSAKITNLAIPPAATQINSVKSFFDGFALLGVTDNNGATAGRTVIGNGLSGLSRTGDSLPSKVASGATLLANTAAAVNDIAKATGTNRELTSDGKVKTTTVVGLVAGVVKNPGPRVPGSILPFIRLLGTVTAKQDGDPTITVKSSGRLLFKTSVPQIKEAGSEVFKAFQRLPIVNLFTKPQ